MESKKNIKRIAWIHHFDKKRNPSSGTWMFTLYNSLKVNEHEYGFEIDLVDIGKINNPILLFIKVIRFIPVLKKYDIIHAQYGSGTGFFTSLFRKKRILSLRGSDWYHFKSDNRSERLYSWFGTSLTKISIRRFNTIIVMSERMKKEVIDKFSVCSVKVIPD